MTGMLRVGAGAGAALFVAVAIAACSIAIPRIPSPQPPNTPAAVTASPFASTHVGPSAGRPAPEIDCGPFDRLECEVVVEAALADAGPVASVRVERYVPGCIRADLCIHPFGGYGASHLVIAADESGHLTGWKCNVDGSTARCERAPREDVEPPATLVMRVVGAEAHEVVLRKDGTRWTFSATRAGTRKVLTVGDWELASPYGCSKQFSATSGGEIEATVTIVSRQQCRIEVAGS